MKNVVIIGGGTGIYGVTQTLKDFSNVSLTNIITVFDSGGSTRRLRDEFGFIPVGDMRQSLAALAHEDGQSWIRELLLYRFNKGEGLEGHNLGNLILTALQDMSGSTPKALRIATKIFRLDGKIYPVSTGKSDLKIEYENGEIVIGEHLLDEPKFGGKNIKKLSLTEPCRIYPKAKKAIEEADYIILGPGDLYASILPNLIVSGTKAAIKKSKANIIYTVNLMTRYTQTHGYTAHNHLGTIESYLGKEVNTVLINNGEISQHILKRYAKYNEFPVEDDLGKSSPHKKIIRKAFASSVKVAKKAGDKTPRSLMRHDKDMLKKVLKKIVV